MTQGPLTRGGPLDDAAVGATPRKRQLSVWVRVGDFRGRSVSVCRLAGPAKELPVIRLTKLSGNEFWLNSDLIEHLEATPDTVVSLVTGHRIVVKESPEEVQERHVAFRADILRESGCSALQDGRAAADSLRGSVLARPNVPAVMYDEEGDPA